MKIAKRVQTLWDKKFRTLIIIVRLNNCGAWKISLQAQLQVEAGSRVRMAKVYAELSEKLQGPKTELRKKVFNFLDSLISFFVVSPLVVGFW